MSKPSGVQIGADASLTVTRPTDVENAIWEAVQAARDAGWNVTQFRREAAEAWAQDQRDEQDRDARAWRNEP